MILSKAVLLGAIPLGRVSAECGNGGTATIHGYPAATPWEGSGCKTFTGSIALATDVSWGSSSIDDIEEITGSFVAHDNPDVEDIFLPRLRKLGTLSLKNPGYGVYLNVISLEDLQNLEWSQLWFPYGMSWRINITKISTFVIEETLIFTLTPDLAGDPSFSSFGNLTTADNIRIDTNTNMVTIGLPKLTSVTESLSVNSNDIVDHIYFPALEWAGSISLRGNGLHLYPESTARLDLPIITAVRGPINVSDNVRMEEILLPTLLNIDGDLLLNDNPTLDTLLLPRLEIIAGDVLIRGNNLQTIAFPALQSVGGSFTVHNLVNGFNCSHLDDIRPLVRGAFRCDDNIRRPVPTPAPAPGVGNLTRAAARP